MSEVYKASGTIEIDASKAISAFEETESKGNQFSNSMNDKLGNTTQQTSSKFDNFTNSLDKTSQKLSTAATKTAATSASAGILGGVILKTGMDFEAGMSRVQAISGASKEQLKSLTDQALSLGESTAFSASECAEAMEGLASSGLDVNQIMDATPGLLDAAASSGEDLASVTQIVTGAMNGFGMTAKDTGHIADVLSKSSADTNANILSMGEALKYCATPAKAAGQTFEEVSAAIGIMADNQIMGSQAGTTLRGVMTRLAKPSNDAAKSMKKLGFNAYDSSGKMLPLSKIVDNLKKSTEGLTDKQKQNFIATVFGQEAMSGMLALMNAGGDKIRKLTEGYEKCDGAAKNMATTMQDNSKSAIEQMHGALETASIAITQALSPTITKVANGLSWLISKFNALPSSMQGIVGGAIFFVAGVSPVLFILAKMIQTFSFFNKGIFKVGKGIINSVKGFKNFALATKAGTNAIGKFGSGLINGIKSVGSFTKAIILNTASAIKNGAIWVANKVKMIAYKTAQVAVTVATKAMTVAQKALNLALRMNPIGLVITLLVGLAAVFVTLYNKCDWFRNGVNKVWSAITSIFTKFDNFLTGIFTTDWTNSFGVFGNIINAFMRNVSNVWNSIKRIFDGIIDFIAGVFTGDWSRAWSGVVDIFGGIMDGLGAVIKAPLNSVIGLINMAIDGMNKISFTVPNFIPGIGGKHFGVNLPKINYLYTGAVFDEPTLLGNTVVGDKFKGQGSQREYVLPEPMIRRVVREEVAEVISKLGIYMDGREVGRCLAKYKDEMEGYSNQLSPFKMG